jgi:hypothetical protein
MARKLFSVEEVFTVHHRGTMLLPGLTPQADERFSIGDLLLLRRPDGSEVQVNIDGIDLVHPGPNGEYAVLVALPKPEVPLGTEIWSL